MVKLNIYILLVKPLTILVKNLIDNYGVELVTINTMESIDGNVSNSNENYVTIMNNNLELFNKELYK